MKMQELVKRKTVGIKFSQDFEALLLNSAAPHISLSHDLEIMAGRGTLRLSELEDVQDIKHVEKIKELIGQTNTYARMPGTYFQQWSVNIAEDLVDEIELLALTHGDDLVELGLQDSSAGTILVMLVLAELSNTRL